MNICELKDLWYSVECCILKIHFCGENSIVISEFDLNLLHVTDTDNFLGFYLNDGVNSGSFKVSDFNASLNVDAELIRGLRCDCRNPA